MLRWFSIGCLPIVSEGVEGGSHFAFRASPGAAGREQREVLLKDKLRKVTWCKPWLMG